MGLCGVALSTVLIILVLCDLHQAISCNKRKTVIQIRISKKTDITLKYPNESDPVKFVPYPYNQSNIKGDCYICNGSKCRICTSTENQSPSSVPSDMKIQQTNIIIDLKRENFKPQDDLVNGDKGNETRGISQKDGTVIVVQGSISASSESKSAASGKTTNGGKAATSSASSAAISNHNLIASFEHNNSSDKYASNIEDIYIEEDSISIAGSAAASKVESKPAPKQQPVATLEPPSQPQPVSDPSSVPNSGSDPKSKPSAPESAPNTQPVPTESNNSEKSNEFAESTGKAKANAEETANKKEAERATSITESKSAAEVTNTGSSSTDKATAKTIDNAKSSVKDDGNTDSGAESAIAESKGEAKAKAKE